MSAVRVTAARARVAGLRHTAADRSVAGQGFGNALLNAATLVFNFVTTLLLSRLLGASGYGAYAFAYALAMLLSVPAVLGLTPLLVREVTAYRLRSHWSGVRGLYRRSNETVTVAAVLLCGGAALLFVVTGWPHGRLHLPSLLALPMVPLIAITSVRQGVMQGFGRVILGRAPEATIAPALLAVSAGALAIVLGSRFSAAWAVAAADVAAVVAAVVGLVFLRRVLPAAARVATAEYETRRWARAAVPLVLFSLVQTGGAQLPTVLLGGLSTPHEAGVYNVAFRVANLLPFLLIAAMPALMPAIAELNVLERHDELQRLMTRSARIVFAGSLPIGLVAILFAGPLLRIFGASFGGGLTALRVLAAAQLVNIACGLPGTILIMLGDAALMTLTFSATTVVTLVLAAALIPSYGANGAAVAAAAGLALSNVVLSTLLWRRRRIYAPAIRLTSARVSPPVG